ncbi:MAG: twin-arginine translocase TatA/TatE family subunit [Bacteroidaceae bacterium]|nr:twin-arginine translocase TatA/TatE family subunit [Bacteroidaceae bacterium]
MIIPMIFGLGTPELLLIAFVFLLLFGAKKIPELMKGLGKGVKSFKDGMNGKIDETGEDNSVVGAAKKEEKPAEESGG